ncbi:MAG: HD domain-containing phosphohydrolase [Candidatus Omnitrophota bacterium]
MFKFKLKSIEDASLIRKFSVLFSLMSFFPFVILSVLFFYFNLKGDLNLSPTLLFWSAFLVGVFALIGFFGMRQTLINLIKISEGTKDILKGKIPDYIDIKDAGENEVAQIARAFNEVLQKLELNIKELQNSKSLLQDVLSKVASGVSSTENVDKFLDIILETTVNALEAKVGLLLLSDDEKKELVIKSSYGLASPDYSADKRIPMDTEILGWGLRQKEPFLIPRIHKTEMKQPVDGDSPFRPPLICAPLIFQNKAVGIILVRGKREDVNFGEDELIILSDIASQIALAIENAKLNADAQKTYLETITALALAVEARDPYSRGHSDRVSTYVEKIIQKLGLGEEKINMIKEAALLHDVGKIGISDEILRKPDSLSESEKKLMHEHPVIGESIILPLSGFSHLRDPIRHHHEQVNGQGYPDNLKGEQISLEAKILAVADAFDAMTTDRPYRKKMDVNQAKEELIKYKDISFDAKVVDAFIECI